MIFQQDCNLLKTFTINREIIFFPHKYNVSIVTCKTLENDNIPFNYFYYLFFYFSENKDFILILLQELLLVTSYYGYLV